MGLNYINITKRPVEQWGGRAFFIVRHSVHYQIRPGILRFSVHILIALLVLVYLCTKIPLWGVTAGCQTFLFYLNKINTALNNLQ